MLHCKGVGCTVFSPRLKSKARDGCTPMHASCKLSAAMLQLPVWGKNLCQVDYFTLDPIA